MINSEVKINLGNYKENSLADSVRNKILKSGEDNKEFSRPLTSDNFSLTMVRESMGKRSKSFAKGNVLVDSKIIYNHIEVAIFRPEEIKRDMVLLFVHGGGFIGGNLFQYKNQLEYLCEQLNCYVVAMNYRLAPENPFPAGLEDVQDTYHWMIKHSEKYGWAADKVVFLGDSAGANLGVLSAIVDSDIKFESIINIYGAVDIDIHSNNFFEWSFDLYNAYKPQKHLVRNRLQKFKQQMQFYKDLYIHDETDLQNQIFYQRDFSNIKRMLYIEGEFDYFRFSNRYMIDNLLEQSQVDIISYCGMDHGFFERLGYCDEAFDCLKRIVNYLDRMF